MDKKQANGSLSISKGVEQPSSINPNAKISVSQKRKNQALSISGYFEGIRSNNRTVLGRAITLVESSLQKDSQTAGELVKQCLPFSGNSLRIGISGVPGAGKSTFIEALGNFVISQGHKVAVLAVDPSSHVTKGSILGDKTRMVNLSANENAFIRPSPSAGTLGGVAQKTRETIVLCEAAGYDVIFVETVGVGQSETAVQSMTDFFLVLMLAGAGDELQGIKRGIIEMADLLVINKSDDIPVARLDQTKHTLENALHLFPSSSSGWVPKVMHCSSLKLNGIKEIWEEIKYFNSITQNNDFFNLKRKEQASFWFYETILQELKTRFFEDKNNRKLLEKLEAEVLSQTISPFDAAHKLIENSFRR